MLQLPVDQECDCVMPTNPNAINHEAGGSAFPHPLSKMKIRAGSAVGERGGHVYHFSAIHTCPAVEPLALSRALLPISYLIVISSG